MPEILAAGRDDVEGVQLHLVVVLARMQRVEVGDAVTFGGFLTADA
ncbi:hypothetical protein IVA88_27855 [Bradyrhizobium sp. 149]|nr:hypothetical protein [Bradyrhizobium sp. 149]MCK1655234.1 hypothetical protein [Bradyrhizobium sp. 149]